MLGRINKNKIIFFFLLNTFNVNNCMERKEAILEEMKKLRDEKQKLMKRKREIRSREIELEKCLLA